MGTVVCGTRSTVRIRLQELLSLTGANELMLSSLIHDFAARERSYVLVANKFDLTHNTT